MAKSIDFKIKWDTRICEVGDRIGFFHTWEQWSKPVSESPIAGGPPAGVISMIFGIVEFPEGVERVDPSQIKFVDEEHDVLCQLWKAEVERREQ